MNILQRDSLPLGGFQGVTEHQLVTDSKAFGPHRAKQAWEGLENFVYLADARFKPYGETKLHKHLEVDVISVMVEGRIAHEGSLEHGQQLNSGDVQVQRAGGEGFSHNEINPDGHENRMIQLWVLPETAGQAAGYQVFTPNDGEITRVYGGTDNDHTLSGNTQIDIARLSSGQQLRLSGESLCYITTGALLAEQQRLTDGCLVRATDLMLTADADSQLIIISRNN